MILKEFNLSLLIIIMKIKVKLKVAILNKTLQQKAKNLDILILKLIKINKKLIDN